MILNQRNDYIREFIAYVGRARITEFIRLPYAPISDRLSRPFDRSLNRGTRGEKIRRSAEKNLHVRSYSFFDNNPRSMAVPGDPDSFRALYSDAYTRGVKCDRFQWHKTL